MPKRADHTKDGEWWRDVALHLRSCNRLKENLSSDALKTNIALRLENLAKICDDEANHCQEVLARM